LPKEVRQCFDEWCQVWVTVPEMSDESLTSHVELVLTRCDWSAALNRRGPSAEVRRFPIPVVLRTTALGVIVVEVLSRLSESLWQYRT
jgi:hypothetical protein